MTSGYNQLVGVRATFSRVISEYRLTNIYRWKHKDDEDGIHEMRGYDMHRHITIAEVCEALRDAYAPATLSIWKQETPAVYSELLQFEVGSTPEDLGLPGDWVHWAQF